MTDLLCALIRGERVTWPREPPDWAARLYDCALDHGVHLLAAEQLLPERPGADCPAEARSLFAKGLREETVLEQISRRELMGVIDALGAEGIGGLLFKGAALAYTHYRSPVLRPRLDADLLVEAKAVPATARVLERLGYGRPPYVSGALVSHQTPYSKTDRHGISHTIDVHWKIANPQVFADALSHPELASRAVAVPALGESARAIGPLDALAVACIHRAAHHSDDPRLIWLYDIHVLASSLTRSQVEEFVALAAAHRIVAVLARGCWLAHECFGTVLPPGLADRLAAGGANEEPSAEFLGRGMRKLDVLMSDLRALRGWADRARLLREHLFPPAAYMLQKYARASRLWLPALYARRVIGGARRWIRESGRR